MTGLLAYLPIDAFIAFSVFCRLGAMMMSAPAFGDFTLSPRIRLIAALTVTMVVAPVVAPGFPQIEALGPSQMALIIFGETAIGLMIGLSARIFVSALNVAGQVIAMQMGLSIAQAFDPTQELQGAIVGGFLAILGTTMIFATDLHHVLIEAIVASYPVFVPGVLPFTGDAVELALGALSSGFSLGVRLAAPFIVFGLVFYIGAGVLNRLMPQAQIFFIAMPANLALGLALLMLTTGLMMTLFLEAFTDFMGAFGG